MNFRKASKTAGIILLYAGLLLLLVSFISQLQVSRSKGSGSLLKGESRTALRSLELLPFQEMKVTATVEEGGALTVYLLETNNIFASSNETNCTSNSTALQEFLEQNPDRIIWKDQIENGEYERSYFSTRFMNAVVVFHNPTSEIAHLHYEEGLKFFGSTDETRYVAVCATPLGALLILPWQVNQWKQRKKK
jgi:hypothetical protein